MKPLKRWMVKQHWLQVFLCVAGILCICMGIYREEVQTVLMKAIYICLECIGIG